jgi:RNA polymerase sigma-54 factor
MKQSLQLRIGQSLTMTPQLQQAIRLLQLSALELQLEVQQALDSNMMLERVEDPDDARSEDAPEGAEGAADALDGSGPEPAADFPDTDGPDDFYSSPGAGEAGAGEASATGTTGDVDASDAEPVEAGATTDIPSELPVDTAWEDLYDAAGPAGSAPAGEDGEFEAQRSAEPGLLDHLRWQLNCAPLSERDQAIAEAIVDGIDPDGYLQQTLEDVQQAVARALGSPVGLDEVEVMLRFVQSLDPLGVGARSLSECLLLQLADRPADTPWRAEAMRLVRDWLPQLAARDFNQLMRRLKLGREQLQSVVSLIQSLNPRPGAHLSPPQIEYVVADVFVRKQRGRWVVELNPDAMPNLRINRRYASLVRRADNSSDNNSLRTHLQEARWFIKSLQSRSETLLRVASAIVERQRDFLEHGEEAMKPLVLHDIAEVLGLHESTISRVTTRKYMHTPRGIFELKYFFSSHVGTAEGGEASSTAIRAHIRKLIAAEDGRRPLSDSQLVDLLGEQGYKVARRTVAKYREAMNIAPSNERKRLT